MRPVGVQAPTTVVRHPAGAVRPCGPTLTSSPSLHVPLTAQPHLRPCDKVRSRLGNLHGSPRGITRPRHPYRQRRNHPPWPRTHRHRGHPSDRRNRPAPTNAAPQEHQLACNRQTSPHRVKITDSILKAIQSRPSPGSHPAPRLPPNHGAKSAPPEQDNPSTPATGWRCLSCQLERRGAPRGVRTAAALPRRRREPARRSGESCRRWTCPAWCAGPGSWPRVLRGSCARRWS
jgi:hypothetical protein